MLCSSDVTRIKAAGPTLDRTAATQLLREADEAYRRGARSLVIELGNVASIDPFAIPALTALRGRAPAGTRIVLAAMQEAAQTLARVIHLHEMFDIYASADDAARVLSR